MQIWSKSDGFVDVIGAPSSREIVDVFQLRDCLIESGAHLVLAVAWKVDRGSL